MVEPGGVPLVAEPLEARLELEAAAVVAEPPAVALAAQVSGPRGTSLEPGPTSGRVEFR